MTGASESRRDLTVEAYDRADTKRLATGTLESVDNEIDTTTGTVKLRAMFDNRGRVAVPEPVRQCAPAREHAHEAMLAPTAAVQHGAPGAFVYMVKPDDKVDGAAGDDRRGRGRRVQIVRLAARRRGCGGRRRPAARRGQGRVAPQQRCRRSGCGPATPARPKPGRQRREQARRRAPRQSASPSPATAPDRRAAMNPSRLFILRPVGDHAVDGRRCCWSASSLIASCRCRRCRRSTIRPSRSRPSIRAQPGGDDDRGHRAAGAAVRRDAGARPDESTSSAGASVITLQFDLRPAARRRRAGSAGGDQRRDRAVAGRPPGAAGLRQDQSRRRAGAHAGANVEDAAARPARRPRRHPHRAEDVAGAWRRPGHDRAEDSARRCASRSIRARSPPTASPSTTSAPTSPTQTSTSPRAIFDGPPRASTINANDQLQTPRTIRTSSSPTRTATRSGSPTWPRSSEAPENAEQAGWANRRRRSFSTFSASRARTSSRSSTAVKALLPQLRAVAAAGGRCHVLTDRTTTIRASVRDVEFELALAVVLVVR